MLQYNPLHKGVCDVIHTHPTITSIFPGLRPSHEGREPTVHEMQLEWQARKMDLLRAARFGEMFSYTHRETELDSEGKYRCRHPTRLGKYGCAVLACREAVAAEDRFVITTGGNFKLRSGNGELIQYHPEERWKMCSEPHAVLSALDLPWRCRRVYGLALYSDNMQEEDVSGIYCNVQHPCSDCRAFLYAYLEEDSPILVSRRRLPCDPCPPPPMRQPITEHVDDLIVEHWTFGEIVRHHGGILGRRHL